MLIPLVIGFILNTFIDRSVVYNKLIMILDRALFKVA